MNLYGFVGNDGVNGFDVLGLLVDITFNKTDGSIKIKDRENGKSEECAAKCCKTGLDDQTDPTKENGPLPIGTYSIMHNTTPDWWSLWYNGDDKFDDVGPNGRKNFRLHAGSYSLGCVTVTDNDCWQKILAIMKDTKHEFKKGADGKNYRYYGDLNVTE